MFGGFNIDDFINAAKIKTPTVVTRGLPPFPKGLGLGPKVAIGVAVISAVAAVAAAVSSSNDELDSEESEYMMWHTQGDDKVRDSHRLYEGMVYHKDEGINGLFPGDDYNCRCWGEPVNI